MTDEINFMCAVCIPQVDRKDKKGAIDFAKVAQPLDGLVQKGTAKKLSGGHIVREVNLFPSTRVTHNKSDAWRWGN